MTEQATKSWEYTTAYQDTFGDYIVTGAKYVAEDGEVAWRTSSWPNENPVHNYWVSNGQIHDACFHYLYRNTNQTLIEIFGLADVCAEEKKAIIHALDRWTRVRDQ
jgi:hypothetical protein